MNLTDRQQQIIQIVQNYEPISGDLIADKLDLSKSTIRSDLAVLSMTGILDARPRVGYIYSGLNFNPLIHEQLFQTPVAELMRAPLLVPQEMSIQDAITDLIMYDSGSLFVIDDHEDLVGVTSRKDLLRFLLAGSHDRQTPIGIIMTRMPNIIVAHPNATIYQTAKLMHYHEIDSIPIVDQDQPLKVLGKISKTSILNHYINLYSGGNLA